MTCQFDAEFSARIQVGKQHQIFKASSQLVQQFQGQRVQILNLFSGMLLICVQSYVIIQLLHRGGQYQILDLRQLILHEAMLISAIPIVEISL